VSVDFRRPPLAHAGGALPVARATRHELDDGGAHASTPRRYIPERDVAGLEPEVREFEDRAALVGGGADGLDVVRAVLDAAPALLKPDAPVWLETHATADQRAALETEMRARVADPTRRAGVAFERWWPDLAGKLRFLQGRVVRVPRELGSLP